MYSTPNTIAAKHVYFTDRENPGTISAEVIFVSEYLLRIGLQFHHSSGVFSLRSHRMRIGRAENIISIMAERSLLKPSGGPGFMIAGIFIIEDDIGQMQISDAAGVYVIHYADRPGFYNTLLTALRNDKMLNSLRLCDDELSDH